MRSCDPDTLRQSGRSNDTMDNSKVKVAADRLRRTALISDAKPCSLIAPKEAQIAGRVSSTAPMISENGCSREMAGSRIGRFLRVRFSRSRGPADATADATRHTTSILRSFACVRPPCRKHCPAGTEQRRLATIASRLHDLPHGIPHKPWRGLNAAPRGLLARTQLCGCVSPLAASSARAAGHLDFIQPLVPVDDDRPDPGGDEHANNEKAEIVKVVVQGADPVPEPA